MTWGRHFLMQHFLFDLKVKYSPHLQAPTSEHESTPPPSSPKMSTHAFAGRLKNDRSAIATVSDGFTGGSVDASLCFLALFSSDCLVDRGHLGHSNVSVDM